MVVRGCLAVAEKSVPFGSRIIHRVGTGNAEKQSFAFEMRRRNLWSSRLEPINNSGFEFARCSTNRSAMIGIRNFPQDCGGITRVNLAGVTHWDVAIDLSMDQENRNFGLRNCVFRRHLQHVQSVFPAGIVKSGGYNRTQDSAAHPRARIEKLSHAVVSNLLEIRKRRLRDHPTETGFGL